MAGEEDDTRAAPARRRSVAGTAWYCVVSALAGAGVAAPFSSARPALAGIAMLIALGMIAQAVIADRRVARATARAARLAADDSGSLETSLDAIGAAMGSIEQRLANRHPVTGLPTREVLFAAIEEDALGARGGVLGLIALTDFERLGAFDPALAEHMLVTTVGRATRMLGARRLIAQVDRARLAVWYDGDVPTETACAQLDALGYALGDTIRHGERELLPEIRIGTARSPRDGTTPTALLARAVAMIGYGGEAAAAKVPPIDPVAVARERYAMEQDLRRAIDRGEFELRYQPLINAAEGRVCGAEALLRWQHPVHGFVSPSRFVPIVEAGGLADEVGLWALNAAAREARGWQRQGLEGLRVAVNVSAHQLDQPDFPALVARTLSRHSLQPQALEIELTETVATGDTERAAALFRELRALGVAIAIDDFGTGYSSFSALRTLAFDKIKIDREFVTAVDRRGDSQAICRSILALGQGLGIRVLAEGVERREEFAWLRRHGCDHFQGYYFAQPLDTHDFQAFVRDGGGLRALLAAPALPDERLRA